MNKYQEAVNQLHIYLHEDECAFILFEYEGNIYDAMEELEELVEKATPKKPIEYPSFASGYKCPNLHGTI